MIDPGLTYNDSPRFKSRSDMRQQRKKVAQEEAAYKSTTSLKQVTDLKQRYLERENFNILAALT